MSEVGVTRAETCVIACAEVWRDAGEVMASPFGVIPSLGARLAKLTFASDLVLTDGEAALMVGAPRSPRRRPSWCARQPCRIAASSTSSGRDVATS